MNDNHTVLIMGILALVNSIVEFWLGKTDKVKSNSVLELVLNIVKAGIGSVTKK